MIDVSIPQISLEINIDHRGKTFLEINTWNLTVSTCNESGSKTAISFGYNDPITLDNSTSFCDNFFLDCFPNFLAIHVIGFFLNCHPPFFSILWIIVILSLFKICRLKLFSSTKQTNIGLIQNDAPSLLNIINNSSCIQLVAPL
jgi:hypothetical protein